MIRHLAFIATVFVIAAAGVKADGLVPSGSSSQGLCYASGSSGPRVPCIQQGTTWTPLLRPTDEGSGLCVKAPGSTLCRPLSARAKERINVADFGATGDGTDQTAQIKAAQAAVPTGLLRFPQGVYNTDGSVPTDGASSTAYEMDAPKLTGGYLNGVQDPDAASRATKLFTVPWGNRFHHGLTIQGVSVPTDPTVAYEKTGILIRYEQRDPTDYNLGKVHDLVGTDWQGAITGRNPTGRIWATSASIQVNQLNDGSDGYVIIHEAGIINNGTAQERMSKINTKVGVSMIADGTANSTTAFAALRSAPDAHWFHGFYVDAHAVTNNAFVLRDGADGGDIAGIKASGLLFGQGLTLLGGEQIQASTGSAASRDRTLVLRALSTGGATVRLTADGAAAGAANVVNIADFTSAAVSIRLIARNATLGSQDVAWTLPLGILHRTSGAGSTGWTAGAPVTLAYGPNAAVTVTASADTSNGGLNLSFTPPSGTTNQWSVTATVTTTETN